MRAALACFLAPILLGLITMALGGAPSSYLLVHAVAAVIGVGLIWVLSLRPSPTKVVRVALCVALLLWLLTFLCPGQAGVHRWVWLGSLRLHVSSLVAPILLLEVSSLLVAGRASQALGLVSLSLLIVVAQPDAAAATGVGVCALIHAVWHPVPSRSASRVLFATVAVLGAAAWWRPDHLGPVDFVEDIVPRAAAIHPALGVIAVTSLLAPIAFAIRSALRGASHSVARIFGLSLAAYLFGTTLAVGLGHFPAPLLGYGASPVIGTALGFGLLLGLEDSDPRGTVGRSG